MSLTPKQLNREVKIFMILNSILHKILMKIKFVFRDELLAKSLIFAASNQFLQQ